MKVLLVSSNSGSRGGGEIYLLRLSEGLTALGHEVHLLLAQDPAMDELAARAAAAGAVHRLPLRNMYRRPLRVLGALRDRPQIARLAAEFERLGPEVLHLNQQVAEDGLDLLAAADRSGLPAVSTIHIPGSPKALGAVAGGLRTRVARRALAASTARHIAVSKRSADELAAWLPFLLSQERLFAVANGVAAPPAAAEAAALRRRFREHWQVADDELVVGCVGRIEAQKNPLFVVEVVAALRARGLPVRAVWLGDGRMRGEVEAAAACHGLGTAFLVAGWQDEAATQLHAFDLFLMPSKFEGLPLALLEAMTAGLTCCASAIDGIPEAIEDGGNGRLCAPGDLAEWTETLSSLLTDATQRHRLGAAAAACARQRFSVAAMARQTLEVYAAAIARRPGAAT